MNILSYIQMNHLISYKITPEYSFYINYYKIIVALYLGILITLRGLLARPNSINCI